MTRLLLVCWVVLTTTCVLSDAFLWRHLFASRHNTNKKHNVTTSDHPALNVITELKPAADENTGHARAPKEEPKIAGESNSKDELII